MEDREKRLEEGQAQQMCENGEREGQRGRRKAREGWALASPAGIWCESLNTLPAPSSASASANANADVSPKEIGRYHSFEIGVCQTTEGSHMEIIISNQEGMEIEERKEEM